MMQVKEASIAGFNVSWIIHCVERILKETAKTLKKEGKEPRNYGYLTIRRRRDSRVLFLAQIGECPSDKADKCMELSQEKGKRLHWHSIRAHGSHLSSWQTRDEKVLRYGGAICAGRLILSFSALPELNDEAAMAELAYDMGLISLRMCRRIAKISKNGYIDKFVELHKSDAA